MLGSQATIRQTKGSEMSLTTENFEQILLRGLQGNLQDQVYKKLVEERMNALRAEVEQTTRAEVEKYTIKSVEMLRNHLQRIDEVQVLIGYKEVK
jgi:hypothetical protein